MINGPERISAEPELQEETPAHAHALRALRAEIGGEAKGMKLKLFRENTSPRDNLQELIFKGVRSEKDGPFEAASFFRVVPEDKGGWRVARLKPEEVYKLLAG